MNEVNPGRDEAMAALGLSGAATPEQVVDACVRLEKELQERLALDLPESLRGRIAAQLANARKARDLLLTDFAPAPAAAAPLAGAALPPLPDGNGQGGAPADRLVGTTIARRYDLIDELGTGGMGRVYRAFDRLKQVYVAVKVIAPEIIRLRGVQERFVMEAKNASTLSHPNIIRVHDVGVDGDCYFITMELLHGRTLRRVMDDQKRSRVPYPVSQGLAMANDLIDALIYAHQHVVHRDIKPENIWVGDDGVVKLMDFGLSLPSDGSQKSRPMQSVGSAYYVAPELLRGASLDHRADQYSLAVVFYELFSGRVPTGVAKPLAELRKDIPQRVSKALMKALSATPAERYATTADFRKAMGAGDESAAGGGIPWRRIAVAAVAIVVLAGGWQLVRSLDPGQLHLFATSKDRDEALRLQVAATESLAAMQQATEEVERKARDAREKLDRIKETMLAGGTGDKKATPAQLETARSEADAAQHALELLNARLYPPAERTELGAQRVIGDTYLKDDKYFDAQKAYASVQSRVNQRLAAIRGIGDFSRLRDEAIAAAASWEATHGHDAAGNDAASVAAAHMHDAEAAMNESRFDEAMSAYRDAAAAYAEMNGATARQQQAQVASAAAVHAQAVNAQQAAETQKAQAEEARRAELLRPGRRFRDPLKSGGQGPEMVVAESSGPGVALQDSANLSASRRRPVALSVGFIDQRLFRDFVQRTGYMSKTEEIRSLYRNSGQADDPDAVAVDDARAYAAWLHDETGAGYEAVLAPAGTGQLARFRVRRPLE